MKNWWTYLIVLPALGLLTSGFRLPEEKKYLGRKVPDIKITDASGFHQSLYSLLRNKPLIISPVYTKCASLCGVISNGTRDAIYQLGTLGTDFNVVSFSFDSTDQSSDLKNYQLRWKMDGNSWKTISADAASIRLLMASVGFEYETDTILKQFNHPALLVVLSPEGRISRYIYGVNPSKRDIRLAVLDAQAEKTTPGLFAGIYLRCFGYDPQLRTYRVDWRFIISTSAGLIIIFIVSAIFIKSFIVSKANHDTTC